MLQTYYNKENLCQEPSVKAIKRFHREVFI